jgi:hypothetical protein
MWAVEFISAVFFIDKTLKKCYDEYWVFTLKFLTEDDENEEACNICTDSYMYDFYGCYDNKCCG